LELNTPLLKASRKLTVTGSTVSVVESTRLGDARVEATRAREVYDAFRKLYDHREFSFIVEMPPLTTATTGDHDDGTSERGDKGTTGY
jgi:hypothetical protein